MKLVTHIKQPGPALYLAPVINTVLVLLMFFFLGSSFVVQSGVPVKVPSSPSRLVGFDRAEIITIAAGPEGKVYLNGVEVPLTGLRVALDATKSATKRAVVYADQQTYYGHVMEVGSVAMSAGFDVAFATTPEAAP